MSIRIKNNAFEKDYELDSLILPNSNSKLTDFFMVKMFYDTNKINHKNLQIYLVNKKTNKETKIL